MKKITLTLVSCLAVATSGNALAQATSAKNTTDKNGKQCSSVGWGKDKPSAEKNREQSEKGAREKGHESHSSKEGGGSAGCRDKK